MPAARGAPADGRDGDADGDAPCHDAALAADGVRLLHAEAGEPRGAPPRCAARPRRDGLPPAAAARRAPAWRRALPPAALLGLAAALAAALGLLGWAAAADRARPGAAPARGPRSDEVLEHTATPRYNLAVGVGSICGDVQEGVAQGAVEAAGVCPADLDRHFATAAGVQVDARDPQRDEELLQKVRSYLGLRKLRDLEGAFALLTRLQGVRAHDVLALQETWTEADSDILRQLDGGTEAFVPGAWRTEVFVQRLPTVADLNRVALDLPTAIVSSARALKAFRFGQAIDGHEAVVRIGSDVGSRLEQRSTGTRTTAHASGSGDAPIGDPDVAEFDLETSRPWASYCRKLHRSGDLSGALEGPLFILRPSVLCKMGETGGDLSVAFWYFWFVGRLSPTLDLYGFVQQRGDHRSELEQVVYSLAHALEGRPALHPSTDSELESIRAVMPGWSPRPPTPAPPPPPPMREGTHFLSRAYLPMHRKGAGPAAERPRLAPLPPSPMGKEGALADPGTVWPVGGLCGQFGKKENKQAVGKVDMAGVCPDQGPHAVPITSVGLPVRSVEEDGALLDDLRRRIDELSISDQGRKDKLESALSLLTRLKEVNAKDVLALMETWTDADTDILRRLDDGKGGFTPDELTTEAFKKRLPTAAQFRDLIQGIHDGTMAMVGAGASLNENSFGEEIDKHDFVVRFNHHIGTILSKQKTGTKMTMHVSCDAVPPVGDPNVAEFDLETGHPWNSYCMKIHMGGQFTQPDVFGFIMRPTVLCSLGVDGSHFTRGFLFYWFVGRLYDHLDAYGFQGKGHFDSSGEVWEPFLQFEHLVYASVAGPQFAHSLVEEWNAEGL